MRSIFLGRMLFVVILAWATVAVLESAPAAAQDDVQAVRQKAEQGDAIAQNNLGGMYYKGEGGRQDYAQARQWFQKAAEQGHADAQKALNEMSNDNKESLNLGGPMNKLDCDRFAEYARFIAAQKAKGGRDFMIFLSSMMTMDNPKTYRIVQEIIAGIDSNSWTPEEAKQIVYNSCIGHRSRRKK